MHLTAQIGMNSEVRRKTLDLIQNWGIAFRGTADLTYICDVYNLLRAEGVQFPPPDANGPGIMLDTNVVRGSPFTDRAALLRPTLTPP